MTSLASALGEAGRVRPALGSIEPPDSAASSGTRIRLALPTKRTPGVAGVVGSGARQQPRPKASGQAHAFSSLSSSPTEDSAPWGLDHHHEDLAFYPCYYNPGFYSPLSTNPSCLVRITRDAGQNATGLIIDEFNWYFPRTEIGRLRVNTEFIRS